jgi:glucosylceramidase
MKIQVFSLILFWVFLGCSRNSHSGKNNDGKSNDTISAWITSPLTNVLFQRNASPLYFVKSTNSDPAIIVDTTVTYQTIDGFGDALTGGSAILLNKLTQENRTKLLNELFATDGKNIGISYIRISIGASDLSDHVFSYDDMPSGEIDPEMNSFSIDIEKTDLIPVLKEILVINPSLKILGSPWSAPVWMKTNNASIGGSLKAEYYDAYAKYFVKYIQAMQAEGIPLDAITIQNEPLYGGNNPSMIMTAADQALFIKQNLGPAFSAAGITTKIIVYDHNADRPDYPLTILSDADAAKYVDGSAFHLYGGSINALTQVHNAHPDKNLYFTEQWVGAPGNLANDLKWHVETLIIGATRNWSRNVIEWNLASDQNYDPHTTGGCDQCLGTVTINGNTITRNPAYYLLAHSAKFVRPGSVRVSTNSLGGFPNVAFLRNDGKKVLIVVNTTDNPKNFNIVFKGKYAQTSLHAGAVGTYIW